MKKLGIHLKELEKEQQNKPKENRRKKKHMVNLIQEVGRAGVVEEYKYEGIEEARESVVKIIGNGGQAEQKRE